MRRVTRFGVAAVLMAAGAAFAGDPPKPDGAKKTAKLNVPNHWEKDEVFTVSATEDMSMEMTVQMPDGAPRTQKRSEKTQSVVVWKCLEVDAEGHPTRAQAWVKSWKQEAVGGPKSAGGADASAAGAYAEVTAGHCRLLAGDAKLSTAARTWCGKIFRLESSRSSAALDGMGLPEELTVGEPWKTDAKALSALLSTKEAPPIDLSKIVMTVTLDSMEETPKGTRLRASIACDGPLTGDIASQNGVTATFGAGSEMKVKGGGSFLAGKAHRDQKMDMDMSMTMNLDMSGMAFSAVVKAKKSESREPSGDMPAAPKVEDAAKAPEPEQPASPSDPKESPAPPR